MKRQRVDPEAGVNGDGLQGNQWGDGAVRAGTGRESWQGKLAGKESS